MIKRPQFLILSQSTSTEIYGLAVMMSEQLGPTMLHTGTALENVGHKDLEIRPAPRYNNSSYATRFKTWSAYSAAALRDALSLRGNPIVMVSSNPPFGPYLGYLLKRLRGWRYIVRILDVYPDALNARELFGLRHPVVRAMASITRLALANAEEIITLGPIMGERVAQYLPNNRAPRIIPDWVDTDSIKPLVKSENRFARQHGQFGKLTFLYSGNYGQTHDLSAVFEVARMLQADESIHFLFIGGGARHGELEERADRLKNLTLLPLQPLEVLPLSITAGDVALIALGRGTEGISMPSKTYYNMAAGCAILGISEGRNDLAQTIETYECGINVAPGDVEGLRATIERFKTDRAFLSRCRKNARKAAVEVYSTPLCTNQYLEIFRKLRAEARPA